MLSTNFYFALSSSFWIIPREGTEALLIVMMLVTALKQSDRAHKTSVIYLNCLGAVAVGVLLSIASVWLHSIFSGRSRELSEAIASLIALAMLLYINFDTFTPNNLLKNKSIKAIGFLAFISVFRELVEVILFYYSLFQGGTDQQLGTLSGLVLGILILSLILVGYKLSSKHWKQFNTIIFSLTPFMIFLLCVMCIGNAVNALQESGYLGFTPVDFMFNNNLLHAQASQEYATALIMFLCSTSLLFIKQFYKNTHRLLSLFILPKNNN